MKLYCLNDLLNWDLMSRGDVFDALMDDESIQKVRIAGETSLWFYTDDYKTYKWYENYVDALATINNAVEYGLLPQKEFMEWKRRHYRSPNDLIFYARELEKTFVF